eukprot:SAG31_NODE_6806_length_1882_cov_1.029164_1_plen_197_part_00
MYVASFHWGHALVETCKRNSFLRSRGRVCAVVALASALVLSMLAANMNISFASQRELSIHFFIVKIGVMLGHPGLSMDVGDEGVGMAALAWGYLVVVPLLIICATAVNCPKGPPCVQWAVKTLGTSTLGTYLLHYFILGWNNPFHLNQALRKFLLWSDFGNFGVAPCILIFALPVAFPPLEFTIIRTATEGIKTSV